MEIHKKQGDQLSLAVIYHNIASIHRARGKYDQALEWYWKVVAIRERASDLRNLAITWQAMGNIAAAQNELSKALDFFTRSRDMFIQIGLPNDSASVERDIEKVQTQLAALERSESSQDNRSK